MSFVYTPYEPEAPWGPDNIPTPSDINEFWDWSNSIFDNMLEAFYEQTDPVDDIDRIYRQQELKAWDEAQDSFRAGEITAEEFKDFLDTEIYHLRELDGWDEYIADIYANVIDFSDSSEDPEDQALADLIEEIGQETYDEAVGVLDQIKDQAGAVVNDPIGAIRDIAKNILTAGTGVTLSDECSDGNLEGWIKTCVEFNVIASIPGLEIPSAVLGSIFGGVTIQEMEDVLVAAGKKWEDIKNGTPNCGENNDQECTAEQILKDVGDWVVSKVGEIFEGVDGSGITVESVLGKLGSFLPPAVAAVIYGEITDEINSAIGVPVYLDTAEQCEALGTKEDPNNPGNCLPIEAVMVDCKDANGEVYATVEEGENCPEPPPVACGENEADFGNGCEPVCEYDLTISATDEACVRPVSAVEEECNKQGKVYDELNDECKEECKKTEFVILADGNCGPPQEPTQCVNNATDESLCEECEDGSLPSQHQNGDCNQPAVITQVECPQNTPNAGQMVDKLSDCGEPTNPTGYDCTKPKPDGYTFDTVAWNQNCGATHCTDGTLKDDDEGTNCPGYVPPEVTDPEPTSDNCDQQDRVTREDGSCGVCKPGFIEDPQGFDQCIQAPPECNDCSCPEYAADNPEECADEPTDLGGGGGGNIGGGEGTPYDEFYFGINQSPTMLTKTEFPISDYLSSVWDKPKNPNGGGMLT